VRVVEGAAALLSLALLGSRLARRAGRLSAASGGGRAAKSGRSLWLPAGPSGGRSLWLPPIVSLARPHVLHVSVFVVPCHPIPGCIVTIFFMQLAPIAVAVAAADQGASPVVPGAVSACLVLGAGRSLRGRTNRRAHGRAAWHWGGDRRGGDLHRQSARSPLYLGRRSCLAAAAYPFAIRPPPDSPLRCRDRPRTERSMAAPALLNPPILVWQPLPVCLRLALPLCLHALYLTTSAPQRLVARL
jgi:hypothetical protein